MKRIIGLLLWVLLPLSALGDGKVLPQTAYAEATIPDQRALICWSSGVERLVIETRFSGSGTNFAWVVPLPNQPEIEAATTGLFPTLAHQLRPKVVHDPTPLFAVFLFCMAVGYLLLFVRKGPTRIIPDYLACAVVATSLLLLSPHGGMLVLAVIILGLLVLAVVRIRLGLEGPYSIVLLLLIAFFFAGMFLPSSLSMSAASTVTSSGVAELVSQRVGVFDTTTLAAKTPEALLDWLRDNHFATPANAGPVIQDYVERGWVFVAAKLHRDDGSVSTNSIHPLSFTFRAQQPVYPLRLTGVGNGPLKVELYVFGDRRAEADHFEVIRCAPVVFPSESPWRRKGAPEEPVPVMHPMLRQWTLGSAVVTKLAATLAPDQMQSDVAINWVPYAPHQQVFYSSRGAAIIAADWAVGLVFGISSLATILLAIRRDWRHVTSEITAIVVGLGLLTLAVTYFALPKVRVRTSRFWPRYVQRELETPGRKILSQWETAPPKALAEARKAVEQVANSMTENVLLGGQIREEDSPGNYEIRPSTNGFEFVWFDADGGEHILQNRH